MNIKGTAITFTAYMKELYLNARFWEGLIYIWDIKIDGKCFIGS